MCLASVSIVAASLIILGIFILIGKNIETISNNLDSNQKVKAFLSVDATDEEIAQVKAQVESFGLTSNVEVETREQAFQKLKNMSMFKGHERLLEGYTESNNPLPPSLILVLKKAQYGSQALEFLKTVPGIKDVVYNKDATDKLVKVMTIVRVVSIIVLIVLGTTSIFVISNTIKLTVFARRKEIGIMKYVGATDWFIRWPFIVESIIIGIFASLVALLIMSIGYQMFIQYFSGFQIVSFVPFSEMMENMMIVYFIIGIGIGCVGSMLSIKKYLKV
jgi:cell division transport system permease protein